MNLWRSQLHLGKVTTLSPVKKFIHSFILKACCQILTIDSSSRAALITTAAVNRGRRDPYWTIMEILKLLEALAEPNAYRRMLLTPYQTPCNTENLKVHVQLWAPRGQLECALQQGFIIGKWWLDSMWWKSLEDFSVTLERIAMTGQWHRLEEGIGRKRTVTYKGYL